MRLWPELNSHNRIEFIYNESKNKRSFKLYGWKKN